MGLRSFLLKKMLKSKMKDVPADQQDKIIAAVEKDPQLFQTIALEVQEKVKNGQDQMAASMEVMQKYAKQLQEVMK